MNNNTTVYISEIGEADNSKAITCITDNKQCCRLGRALFGEWHYPNVTEVHGKMVNTHFYRTRGNFNDGTVHLNRRNNAINPTGLFCCMIPDAADVNQTLCTNIGMKH